MNSEQLVNDIEKLKQHNILIENKLQELRIFYITNKDKYDYDYKLARTFLDNLRSFIEKEIINVDMYYIGGFEFYRNLDFGSSKENDYIIINYSRNFYSSIINDCLIITEHYNSGSNRIINPERYKLDKISADYVFKLMCNYGEEMLILGMVMQEKKLKCYENLLKLYLEPDCEKPEIEKNSIISNELVISSNKTLIALDDAYSKINKYEKKLTELYSESKCNRLEIEKNSIISNELVISSNKTLIALDKAYYKIEEYGAALDDAYSKINKYEIKFTELYTEYKYEKQVIEKKQYSVSASVIFLIMIVFYVITLTTIVLVVNYNYNYNYNYDYDLMHHSMQCSHNTRLIDKHNKLANKDIMII